jgi:hypothetical protein
MAVITASPKNFSRLLELQETANVNLNSIRTILENSRVAEITALEENKESSEKSQKAQKDVLDLDKELLKTQKEMLDQMREDAKARAEDAADIAKLVQGVATFKSVGEKIKSGFDSFKGKFSASNLRKSFLSATNIGGINNRRLAREQFIEQQTALGVKGSRSELKEKFEGAQVAAKNIQATEAELENLKKTTGLNEEQLGKTERGKELLQKREQSAAEYSKFDVRAGLVSSGALKPEQPKIISPIPTAENSGASSIGEDQEAQIENVRMMNDQTGLLQKIEENTRPGGSPTKPSGGSESGGLGGIGAVLKGLGLGIGGLGKGIGTALKGLGLGIGGLGKGIGTFIRAIGAGAGKGIMLFLRGLATGLAMLANPASLIGLGAFTLAMIGLGKALELAAPAIEAFAPVLMKVAEVVGTIFVAAIEKIPEIIKAVGEVVMGVIKTISDSIVAMIDAVIGSIERLAAIDGSNLLAVGAGLVAVAGGLAAFGAASAISGVANLVGGLLGAVTPGGGPVEQIVKLSKDGPNIEKAGIGVEKLATGLAAFSGINTEKIKAIAAMPTEKIAAMGAAMQTPANQVTVGSAQNASAKLNANANIGQRQTNVVNAPVTNNTNNTNLIKTPARNQESSQSRYVDSKWVTAR